MEFILQPSIYSTGRSSTLLGMLDNMWIRSGIEGKGTIYIVSGFSNYNGGVRFYPFFARHVQKGGKIEAYIGGSTAQKLSSIQVVEALLQCGATVTIVNRKRLLHAKCYGFLSADSEELVVTSGNFTGPGMSQNAEAALRIGYSQIKDMNFSWTDFTSQIKAQNWDFHTLNSEVLGKQGNPAWRLLYDEVHGSTKIDDSQATTMIITLSGSDTARIQAEPGTSEGKGTQYFWLTKSAFDFFPALTIKNQRGVKNTYSCIINLHYVDLNYTDKTRVTFEADNNLDFRLGTGPLRYTRIAARGDLALITRIAEYDYELRIVQASQPLYHRLLSYATNYIGNYGKRYGYISNDELYAML